MLNRIAFYVVAILLAVLPFHAFGWTWFHSFFWQANWTIVVQAWKEIFVGLLVLLALFRLPSLAKKNWQLLKTPVNLFALALILLALGYAIFGPGDPLQRVYGLRTATLFLVAFLAIQLFEWSPIQRTRLIQITLGSAAFVILFGILQKTVLPPDFLAYFGYSENISSWLPGGNLPMYHLIGETDIIRLQSTFAGPNQLSTYLLVVLPLAAIAWWRQRSNRLAAIVTLGSLPVFFFTYSRAVWIGLACILLSLVTYQWRSKLKPKLRKKLLLGGIVASIALISLITFQSNFSEIVFRRASTSAHFERSLAAIEIVKANPLGLGIGTTAGVSQRFDSTSIGLTPENTYLGITLELGWLGGLLFLGFLAALLLILNRIKSPLRYSLVGIMTVALFLHPLEDSPTALTLFLLAGITITVVEESDSRA